MIKFVLLFVLLVLTACSNYVDVSPVRHITEPFINAMADKNIAVNVTYQCGSNYRKDWFPGTYMRLTGTAFVWTDGQGLVHLHAFTQDPPMSLDGYRPPMTLHTAPFDMDGNVVVGDPEYWIRYRLWQTRPCVDLTQLLHSNHGAGLAWNYWLDNMVNVHKYQKQWEALGFSKTGRIEMYGAAVPMSMMDAPDLGNVDWTYSGDQVGYTAEPPTDNNWMAAGAWLAALAVLLIGMWLLAARRIETY